MNHRTFGFILALGLTVLSRAADPVGGSLGYSRLPLTVNPAGQTGFRLLPPARTGITFTNQLAVDRYLTNQIYLNGAGVALGDVDGDGLCDIYLCGIDNANALYRNLGDWKFQDITAEAGVACEGLGASGAALADLNGDGHLDLIVNSVGQGTHLFANNGKGQFAWLTRALPLNPARAGMTLALADIDGDGDLDLYIVNYRTETLRDHPQTRLQGNVVNGKMVVEFVDGRPTTEPDLVGRFLLNADGRIQENGEVDLLLRNEGDFRFSAIPFTQGAFRDEDDRPLREPPYDWGLSAMFRDLNGDGAPDLYVANDFESPDRIWINQGQGQFRAIPRLAFRHTSLFSMGVDVGDLNRDGFDDIFVSDMMMQDHSSRHLRIGDIQPVFLEVGAIDDRPQYSGNTLSLNRGDGTYANIGWFSRSQASGWTWCPVLVDIDLDGYEDIIFPTGHERDMMNVDVTDRAEAVKGQQRLSKMEQLRLRMMFDRFDTPNVAFRNRGDLTFEDVSQAWGFTANEVSQGIALGDLDNDGDLDVVVNNLNSLAGIYENTTPSPRVAVRLKGKPGNTLGVGARITLLDGAVPSQAQEIISGGRYLSSDDPMRVFAAGSATQRLRLQVDWRSGLRSVVDDVRANHLYLIEETGAQPFQPAPAPVPQPAFVEVESFKHTHTEPFFEDYHRQPMLPNRLSQLGPGVAWYDVNEDGWDDLVIGSGQGGHLALFHNDQNGGFKPAAGPFLNRPVTRDQTTVLAIQGMILAGSANYEDGLTNGGYLRVYDLKRAVAGDSVLGPTSSAGPLALADIDGDGDLDLFIGGRVVAARYPEPADSLLLRNEGGRLVVAHRWEKLGLVSAAVFSDLDLDGDPDLVLACDWGPIRVFRNDRGAFTEITSKLGLADLKGWWTGVATGDFNHDGLPDLVVGNWGLNSQFKASPDNPRRLYYGDIDDDGLVDLIEAIYDPILKAEVPDRGLKPVSFALPWLKEQIGSYEAYGRASLQDLYGELLKKTAVVEVNTLATTLFLNRGDRFEPRPLPVEAQWTTTMGVCVGDYDGDGHDDVFLSQNFFAVAPEAWRQDAGRGLWLRGDGKGNLQPVSAQLSGIRVYGEQRGCALADFDQDGRPDLVVTQNGAATRLFRNATARPGLRVRLLGPPGNPYAVGAMLRLQSGAYSGPAREIQAGSGYWSQNSPVQVLGQSQSPAALEIRWPGGRTHKVAVPKDALQITVSLTGEVAKVK
ncbi:MAG: VCBS repeat-containing protein [Verrucomicrobia bacterium]|nr:VCBS repeat-containing protein [Verrucomicrobiota bacterium]